MNQAEVNFTGESGNDAIKSACGCCGSGPTSINRMRKEELMSDSASEEKTTIVTAPEIVCGGCASSIKKALGNVVGVSEVDVDIATKTVTVKHAGNVSRENIADALDRAGYSVG